MRPDWDDYFLGIAQAVSARADCTRRKVGAVLVRDNRIVSTGYNGGPAGGPSCLAGECPRGLSQAAPGESYEQTECIAIHAEMNAIIYAGRDKARGAVLYTTDEPCYLCQKVIQAAGVIRVVSRPA